MHFRHYTLRQPDEPDNREDSWFPRGLILKTESGSGALPDCMEGKCSDWECLN